MLTPCSTRDCQRPARCAIRTRRPSRANLQTTIYYDEREAPKAAVPYCKTCAQELVPGLLKIIDNDEAEVPA